MAPIARALAKLRFSAGISPSAPRRAVCVRQISRAPPSRSATLACTTSMLSPRSSRPRRSPSLPWEAFPTASCRLMALLAYGQSLRSRFHPTIESSMASAPPRFWTVWPKPFPNLESASPEVVDSQAGRRSNASRQPRWLDLAGCPDGLMDRFSLGESIPVVERCECTAVHSIDVEIPLQVIDLVLKDASVPSGSPNCFRLATFIQAFHAHAARSRDYGGEASQAETSFKELGLRVCGLDDLGIDDHMKRNRSSLALRELV